MSAGRRLLRLARSLVQMIACGARVCLRTPLVGWNGQGPVPQFGAPQVHPSPLVADVCGEHDDSCEGASVAETEEKEVSKARLLLLVGLRTHLLLLGVRAAEAAASVDRVADWPAANAMAGPLGAGGLAPRAICMLVLGPLSRGFWVPLRSQ